MFLDLFSGFNLFILLASVINCGLLLAIIYVNIVLNKNLNLLGSNKKSRILFSDVKLDLLDLDEDLTSSGSNRNSKLNRVMLLFAILFLVQNLFFAFYFLFNTSKSSPLAPMMFSCFECVIFAIILKLSISGLHHRSYISSFDTKKLKQLK